MTYHISERMTFGAATTETTLYVDIVAGFDGYDGTVSSPLKTIQEAIYRFFPPYSPAQFLDSSDLREIILVYTPGMPSIQEQVVKPLHKGGAVLYIRAQHRVEASVVQSGSLALETGHQSLRRINFTTAPFVGNTLQDGYFVLPTDPTVGGALVPTVATEISAIVNNGDGYVLAPFSNPEIQDAFGFTNASTLDIVQPQIEWDSPTTNVGNGAVVSPLITNQGGGLIIQGFIFDRSGDPSSHDRQTLVLDHGTEATGSNTSMILCRFANLFSIADTSSSLMISSSYMDMGTNSIQLNQVRDLTIARCHLTGPAGELQVRYSDLVNINSSYISRYAGITNKVQIIQCRNCDVSGIDFRTDVNLIMNGSGGSVQNCTFEGMGSSCITVDDKSHIVINSVTGSAGNTSHGVEVGDFASVRILGSTVTGTLGDIRVGSSTGLLYSDLPVTDIGTMSRAE